jgi:c-di-GMP-binding flagellar brake protein YcgR
MDMRADRSGATETAARDCDDFCVDSPHEIAGLLEELADRKAPLTLSTPAGARATSAVTSLDAVRRQLCLAAAPHDHQLQGLIECNEVLAMAYLDSVMLQFELHDLVLVHGARECALSARLPRRLYRFQRRGSFRVCPVAEARPTATLLHPAQGDLQIELRVLDVSIGGVALFLPDELPPIEPGVRLHDVLLELDGDTRLAVGLAVHHITLLHPRSGGVRLGCETLDLGGEGARILQCYIDHTQKRRRLLAL